MAEEDNRAASIRRIESRLSPIVNEQAQGVAGRTDPLDTRPFSTMTLSPPLKQTDAGFIVADQHQTKQHVEHQFTLSITEASPPLVKTDSARSSCSSQDAIDYRTEQDQDQTNPDQRNELGKVRQETQLFIPEEVHPSETHHQSQSRISLKFKHSVTSNWLPSMRKKHLPPVSGSNENPIVLQKEAQLGTPPVNDSTLKTENHAKPAGSKGFFPKKSTKRISLAPTSLIPKRFSLSHQQHSAVAVDNALPTSQSLATSNKKLGSRSPTFKEPSTALPASISPLPLSPNFSAVNNTPNLPSSSPTSLTQPTSYRQVLDRNTSFSSSTPSEKSTIGKSLNAFKRTTKSILFLESNSNGSASQSSSANNIYNYNYNILDSPLINRGNIEEMSVIRRSLSYTEAERKQAIFFADNSPEITRRHVVYDSECQECLKRSSYDGSCDSASDKGTFSLEESDGVNIKPSYAKNMSKPTAKEKRPSSNSLGKNRQRSKTIDNSENPLVELANITNTGLLSSLTNFVKINRNSVSTSSFSTKVCQDLQSLPKLDHLEVIEGETPAEFLSRLLNIYPLTHICEILSSEDNEMLQQTLQEYLKAYYDFSTEPLDMALRTFLMLNYLPKETQQIDRFIYQFAKYYHIQHPELGFDHDTVYILTYSLIMVHTDKFNPNNKRKMTRFEFVQNVLNALENNYNSFSRSNELTNLILKELLGYFFDNITYCPLIKISQEQSAFALESLESKLLPFPYPNLTFLNSTSTGRGSDHDYRKSSISSSTMSIPSSSTSINRSGSQPVLQGQPPLRKKSSAFLWTSSSIMDPYDYIVKNDKDAFNELKLLSNEKDISITCKNPFILPSNSGVDETLDDEIPSSDMVTKQLNDYASTMNEEIDPHFLTHIWKSLTESRIDFIFKVPKDKGSYLMSNQTEAIPLNESNGEHFYLTRVIKVGLIDLQEISPSHSDPAFTPVLTPELSDLSIISDSKNTLPTSKNQLINKYKNSVWKRYFCILTVVGMFFFKDVSSFRMKFCGKSESDGTKMVIIEESTKTKTLNGISEASCPTSNGTSSTTNSASNSNSDSTGFISFSHFRSEKVDKLDKAEKEKSASILPSFVISNGSFAIRKLENVEYDEIINDMNPPTIMTPPQNCMSESSTLHATPSVSSAPSAISPKPSTAQLSDQGISQISISEESEQQASKAETDSGPQKRVPQKIIAKPPSWTYTFFIYGKGSRKIFMVPSLTELKSWMHSINIMSVLNGVKINSKPLDYTIIPKENANQAGEIFEPKYYEIVPECSMSIEERFVHRASDDLISTDERNRSSNEFDDWKNDQATDSKNQRRRNRSSTTFLSKLTPSIPTLGLGLNSGAVKNDSDKKLQQANLDEFSDHSSSESDSDRYSTDSLRPFSTCEDDIIESYATEENHSEVHSERAITEQHESVSSAREFDEETSADMNTTKVSSTDSSTNSTNAHQYLLEHLYSVKRLALTMPMQKKTRENLLSTAKILGIKLEWLWYEKCRAQTISVISKRVMALGGKNEDCKEGS